MALSHYCCRTTLQCQCHETVLKLCQSTGYDSLNSIVLSSRSKASKEGIVLFWCTVHYCLFSFLIFSILATSSINWTWIWIWTHPQSCSDLHFRSLQPDTSLQSETTDIGPFSRTCLFTPQLLLLLIMPTTEGVQVSPRILTKDLGRSLQQYAILGPQSIHIRNVPCTHSTNLYAISPSYTRHLQNMHFTVTNTQTSHRLIT